MKNWSRWDEDRRKQGPQRRKDQKKDDRQTHRGPCENTKSQQLLLHADNLPWKTPFFEIQTRSHTTPWLFSSDPFTTFQFSFNFMHPPTTPSPLLFNFASLFNQNGLANSNVVYVYLFPISYNLSPNLIFNALTQCKFYIKT